MRNGFDAEFEIENIIDDIRHYFATNGNKDTKAIIGISGGKDSTIAAALLVRALGNDRVIGVLMPDGDQKDIADARAVCEYLHIQNYTINIKYTTASFIEDIERNSDLLPNAVVYTNMPARVRMTTLYNIAAMVGGRVINTGNKSEAFVGYTTKYGDLAGDYAVLRDYYVTEIYKIGDALKLPEYLVHKDPSDGMSGKTDADNMGFSYETLDNYLMNGIVPSADVLKNILDRHARNRHKEVIHLPHPECRSRPYLSGTARQKYVNDEDAPFSF
jgi:NAD+ synthase